MLIINLVLSEDTAEVARALLREWMRPETTAASMVAFIDSTPAGEDRSGDIP
jgi:hypothetical protein